MWRKSFILIVILLIILSFTGCAPDETGIIEEEPDLRIVTTIYPLADIAGRLGGDKVEVSYLLPAGSSPHTYEPTVEQARLMVQADLLIFVGADLDNWAVNMTDAIGPELATINVSEKVELIDAADYFRLEEESEGYDHDHCHDHDCDGCEEHDDHADHDGCGHDHGPEDPHFWLDPVLVRDSICPAIHEKLMELYPEGKDYFENRHKDYRQELNALDEEINDAVSGFSRTNFVAFHSAWQYFARRYGLEEVAVIAQFPGQEPSAGWIAELVDLIRAEEIGAIFAEPQFSPELAERIAEESGAEVMIIDPLGGEGVPGRESYLELMRFNLSIFKEAME